MDSGLKRFLSGNQGRLRDFNITIRRGLRMKQGYSKQPFAAMLLGLALVLGVAVTAHAADGKDLVLKGDAKCTSCHDQDEKSVMAIGKTRHGATGDSRT